jgi:hypothetical protein
LAARLTRIATFACLPYLLTLRIFNEPAIR